MWLVSFTEMWERFSYWGLAGLLTLYLTAAPAAGGWGWTPADAIQLYGWYGGLAFALPLIGAWIANSHLGERRCILLGGLMISAGHVLLAAPAVLPQATAVPGPASLTTGQAIFLAGLLMIVCGTGLLKPAISSIVAQLYPEGGLRRNEAFACFFVAIYVGALLGALVPGYLGERVGWHHGLTAAAFAMIFGITLYAGLAGRWLGDIGREPVRHAEDARRPLTRVERQRVTVLFVQGAYCVVYAMGFYQSYGLLNVYARDELDRHVAGFEVPTTWLQSVPLCSFFVFVPVFAALWRRLDRVQRDPSASYKLALGLSSLATAYLVIAVGAGTAGSGKPHVVWLAGAYLLFGLGDALVWANQMSLTSKLAPAGYTAFCVGAWYLCIGLGNWLTGLTGRLAEPYSYSTVFVALAVICTGAAALLAVSTPALRRWMHGAERSTVIQ